MKIQLDKRFQNRVKGVFEKYSFEVGILEDKIHKLPKKGVRGLKGQDVISSYAGGPVRKTSTNESVLNVSDVSKANRDRLRINYLTAPFKKKSSDIIKFSNEFFKLAFGRSEKKRCENLLQAIVRNPILRGEYGSNSEITQKIKGFDRGMIDTAQLFKSIKAMTKVRTNV